VKQKKSEKRRFGVIRIYDQQTERSEKIKTSMLLINV
jgi:hypothetical protein